MGGIVVYTKLNPYLVMVHFLASLLAGGRRRGPAAPGQHATTRPARAACWSPGRCACMSRLMVLLLTLVLAAGSATTGAGPDAGSSQGQVRGQADPGLAADAGRAARHAWRCFLVGFALALAVALHAVDVPERVRRAGRILVVVLVAPGRRRLHPVLHPPAGAAGGAARARGHGPGDRGRPSSSWPSPTTRPSRRSCRRRCRPQRRPVRARRSLRPRRSPSTGRGHHGTAPALRPRPPGRQPGAPRSAGSVPGERSSGVRGAGRRHRPHRPVAQDAALSRR